MPASLTSVTVNGGNILFGAFSNCSGLENIYISDGITNIGECAFYECSGLTSVVIPESVTAIDSMAFNGCTSLPSIVIGDGVTSIGDCAFQNCTGLTSIIIPNGVTKISGGAFNGCSSLTSIAIPASVTSIDPLAVFAGCTNLKEIRVNEDNANYASDDAGVLFNKDKTRLMYFPGGFSGSYSIPDSVTYISEAIFQNCTGLTSITISDSMTEISWSLFSRCTGLTSITIPESITSIGGAAFEGCNNLTDVYYTGNVDQWQQISVESGNECLLNAKLHAVATTATFGTVKHNLYLEDLTTIGYHCEITPNGTVDKFGILIWTGDPNKEVAVGMEGVQDKELVPNGNLYFAKSDGIYSQYLSVEHYAKPYVKIGDDYKYSPNVDTYTPVAYTGSALQTENEKLKNTTVSLLNYGTYAQIYFAANKGETVAEADKINQGLTDEQKSFGWNENLQVQPHEVSKNTAQTLNMQWYGTNLSLLDKLQMNMAATGEGIVGMYYWTEEDYNDASVLDATTATDILQVKEDVHETAVYYIGTIENIDAKELGSVFYVCAYDEQGNLGPIRADSVAAYATRLMNSTKPTTTSAAKDLAKALLIYGNSAKTYFDSIKEEG